ncbi:MAG: hypothetical protein ABR521_12135, partial [Gaiellaceae bacterium]
ARPGGRPARVSETLTIARRFRGPPDVNGGYAAGLVAALLGGGAEVTLRSPPPAEGCAGSRGRPGSSSSGSLGRCRP